MDEEDYKDKSKEDIIHELLDALQAIKELEDENQDLETALEAKERGGKKGGKGGGRDMDDALAVAELQHEVEELTLEKERSAAEMLALQEKLSESNAVLKSVQQQKTEAEVQSREYLKRIQGLEAEVEKVARMSRAMEQQSKEAGKQKSATVKETKRLFEENDQLREENSKLTESVNAHAESIKILEEHMLALADEKEELELTRDKFDLLKEDLQNQIIQLEFQLEQANEKLQVAQDAETDVTTRMEQLRKDSKTKLEASQDELRTARAEISAMRKEITLLKDSTLIGEKQRELDRERAENKDHLLMIEQLRIATESVVAERDQLAARILETETKIDMRVAERVVAEREQNRILERSLKTAQQRLEDETEKVSDLESEKQLLVREIDELTNWKTIYEGGHGLQELARNQKKLKDDNRRLGVAVEQMTSKLGVLMDMNGIYMQAFERLKKDCGKDPDFMYPEYELQEELKGEKAVLKAQVAELEEQINSLEEESVRLRKALKNQAGVIGEKGFKYAGMTAEQLMRVNEFASNLKDGIIELPMTDRSLELLKENRLLRDEIKTLNIKIEGFERELGLSVGGGNQRQQQQLVELIQSSGILSAGQNNNGLNKKQESELFGLREDVQRLLHENADLHNRIVHMQSEIMVLLRNRPADNISSTNSGGVSQSDITAVLLANNEALMKEVQELRRGVHMHPPSTIRQMQPQMVQPETPQLSIQVPAGHPNHQPNIDQQLQVQPSGRPPLVKKPVPPQPAYALQTPTRSATPSGSAQWTAMGMSGMGMGAGIGIFGPPSGASQFATPATPDGKQMLARNISQMNLPPEEWTAEVRDLNAQLVESLEQLFEREQELEEHQLLITNLEDTLVAIKQQMAALYYDYSKKMDTWEEREKQYRKENLQLRNERDDLALKVSRTEEIINMTQKEDVGAIEAKVVELNRKVLIMEVNENVLSRKFVSQNESLALEQETRLRLEADFVEMESTLKKRILYLEQYKAAMSSRLGHLQGRLDKSVPQEDFMALQLEIDSLREDHLVALRREVEARVAALKTHDQARELRALKVYFAQTKADLAQAEMQSREALQQLEHQKALTQKAATLSQSSGEMSALVSEMAKYRGEASRLEIELMASQKRCELLGEQIQSISREADALTNRVRELESREEEASRKESDARKEVLETKVKFDGGLTRSAAEELQAKFQRCTKDLEAAQREALRNKEVAEIASLQAQSMGVFKQQRNDEARELREYCAKLESRGDDELLIGKLQRQLMSTKTSYKAFARKYQLLRSDMRQREIALRLLETRLDQREEAALDVLETHRLEVSALKKALRSVNNLTINTDYKASKKSSSKSKGSGDQGVKLKAGSDGPLELVPVGKRLVQVSEKVSSLADLTESSLRRAAEAEENAMNLEGSVESLQVEKELLLQRCQDLTALTKPNTKPNILAARLVSLSEDIRNSKITFLQQKRQIQVLKQEKRHLQNVISAMEVDVEDLEQGRIMAETRNLLNNAIDDDSSKLLPVHDDGKVSMLHSKPGEGDDQTVSEYRRLRANLISLAPSPLPERSATGFDDSLQNHGRKHSSLLESSRDGSLNGGLNKVDELVQKLDEMKEELMNSKKEEGNMRLALDRSATQCRELEAQLKERDDQIAYCERVLHEEGLPSIFGTSSVRRPHPESQYADILRGEQDKLQEAASATVGSLRALLDEKNRQLDRYRERIEELQRERKVKTRADRKAEELLEHLDHDGPDSVRRGKAKQIRQSDDDPLEDRHHSKLLAQIEQADEMLLEKDRIVSQLEQKLQAQTNQRERAEIRCGAALQEMEAMKSDMATLYQQLTAAKAVAMNTQGHHTRPIHQPPPVIPTPIKPGPILDSVAPAYSASDEADRSKAAIAEVEAKMKAAHERKVSALQKVLQAKDEKLRGYHEMIIRLKDEFVKSEEEKAIALLNLPGSSGGGSGSGIGAEEARELKNQIFALRDGLRQAKEDVEKGRKAREKLNQARVAAQEETEKISSQLSRAEAQAAAAQDSLLRTRKELEETRRKEVRLRDKLKELLETEAGSDKLRDLKAAGDQIAVMNRELEVLRAQNSALRIAVESAEGTAPTSRPATLDRQESELHDRSESKWESSTRSNGYTLGEAPGGSGTNMTSGNPAGMEDYRQQMHAKWENEKKLQKRVATLEKRLQEKLTENEELQAQIQRAREATQSAVHTRDEMHKKVAGAAKLAQESRKLTMEDLFTVKEAQERVFELEQVNSALKRRIEVDHANEVASLRSQLATFRTREQELLAQLDESEARRKKAVTQGTAMGSSGRSMSLRDSEDRFLVEERLKDDLEQARRQRLSLEAELLDRDARAMEHRFDLEAKDEEIERLKRRLRELEAAYQSATSLGPTSSAAVKPLTATGIPKSTAASSKREAELEGVVDAMKRVVEKLRSENERLRRGGVQEDDRRLADAEKKAASEKKRADRLDGEVNELQAKLKALEDGNQKLVQRQQMIANLRKQLKSKEDEVLSVRNELGTLAQERDELKRRQSAAETKIQQLEVNVQHSARIGAMANQGAGAKLQEQVAQQQAETSELKRRTTDLSIENEALKAQLASAKLAVENATKRMAAISAAPSDGGSVSAAELSRLRKENEDLKKELSSFDFEFFEEIENLKYAHAEAVRKLRMYEATARR